MKRPDYIYGDKVKFRFGEEILTGVVEIVDRYGTFEQNDEPSYDLYRKENNTLYKHVRESLVVEGCGRAEPEERIDYDTGRKLH